MQAAVEPVAPKTAPPFDVAAAPAAEVNPLALVTLSPEKFVAEVYKPFKDRLSSAIDSVRAVDYDIKTTAGMAAAVKCRALFRDLRVEADKEREARKKPITKIGKLLESGFDGIEERIAPIEQMFDFDIQRETKRKADEKAERERIAAERIANIRGAIDSIRVQSAQAVGQTAAELRALLDQAANRVINETEFAEFTGEAQQALDAVGEELLAMYNTAREREEAAAEAARKLAEEQARIEAERAELARQRVEQAERERLAKIEADRVAAEQAAEGKRIADLFAAEQAALQAERDRIAAEQAQAAAELKAAQDKLATEQAAHEARLQLERDHAEALELKADIEFDLAAAAEVERQRLQSLATQHLTDNRPPLPESVTVRDALIDDDVTLEVTDEEIIKAAIDAVEELGLSTEQAIDQLAAIDFAKAREAVAA